MLCVSEYYFSPALLRLLYRSRWYKNKETVSRVSIERNTAAVAIIINTADRELICSAGESDATTPTG